MLDLSHVGVEVTATIAAPAALVWGLLIDLSLTPAVNRETVEASWLPPADGAIEGAVFSATNELGDQRWSVECHVTRCVAPRSFHWTVLDPANPSSSWWYELEPIEPSGVLVRHGFRHGPNVSGLRRRIEEDPASRDAIIAFRTEMLRANMVHTLDQYKQRAEAPGGGRATDR